MANMSYCRYQNTASDLQDVVYDLRERADMNPDDLEALSSEERLAFFRILALAHEIVDNYDMPTVAALIEPVK